MLPEGFGLYISLKTPHKRKQICLFKNNTFGIALLLQEKKELQRAPTTQNTANICLNLIFSSFYRANIILA